MALSYRRQVDYHRARRPNPRVRIALQMYETGAAPTKKEAARAVGLNPQTLYYATGNATRSHHVDELTQRLQGQMETTAVNVSALIDKLSEQAIAKLGLLMHGGEKEEVQLRAAIDLADRGTRTAKIHKMQVEPYTIDDATAKTMAQGLVAAAAARQHYLKAAEGDYITVESDESAQPKVIAPPEVAAA